jgi:hypothetical protein
MSGLASAKYVPGDTTEQNPAAVLELWRFRSCQDAWSDRASCFRIIWDHYDQLLYIGLTHDLSS